MSTFVSMYTLEYIAVIYFVVYDTADWDALCPRSVYDSTEGFLKAIAFLYQSSQVVLGLNDS